MELLTLGNSSLGNAHQLIAANGESLLLDCGIDYKLLLLGLKDYSNINACLITHGSVSNKSDKLQHLDHSKSQFQVEKSGIQVFGTHNCEIGKAFEVGGWKILPIPMRHTIPCFGFVIYNKTESVYILYATDTTALPKIADREYLLQIIECNYDIDTVLNRAVDDTLGASNYNSHLSLEALEEWLKNRKCKPKNLVLTHLSAANSNPQLILETLKPYAENVMLCKKGESITCLSERL